MNGQHLRAFLWLRWRLRVNQLKRGGMVNAVILAILSAAAVVLAAVLFAVSIPIGAFVLKDVPPAVLLYVWDGLVVAFLFFWTTGLLTDLQRFESLSLGKFLHLPVSLSSAFLINYLSSLPSFTLLFFLPAVLGLNLGLLFGRGPAMLWLPPMLASFLLMVTALTYQFQGWLAALMTNPRRRRTVIVVATMTLILISQAPNLLNIMRLGGRQPADEMTARPDEETAKLLNVLLPPGWLPAGVEAAAEGRVWPIALAILGPGLIGTASLWRSYRTTLRLYTGQYNTGRTHAIAVTPLSPQPLSPADKTTSDEAPRIHLLEKKLPWLTEQTAVIALGGFRSLLRAPEAKMLLLTPFLLVVIFGSMFLVRRVDLPQTVRPLLPFGAMMMILFSLSQLIGNQFGFDRNGFRVFVLCPARRRDILLGKNLAVAPLALALGAAAAVFVQIAYPMRFDHFLALAPRFVAMYLLYCLPANALSIFAPVRIASGSFKAAHPGGIAILLNLLFVFLCPVLLVPTLLPLGIEWAVQELGWLGGMPIDLVLSLLECAVVVYLYHLILRWQGDWLQAREQRILQIVTTRVGAE